MTAKSDLPRLADLLEDLSTRLRADGDRAWDASRSWQESPKMPAVGQRGGGMVGSVLEDRKAEAAAQRRAGHVHDQLRQALTELDALSHRVDRLLNMCMPEPYDEEAELLTDDDWCKSCLRIQKHSPRTVGALCDFCWSHQRETSRLPSVDLLQARHEGRKHLVKVKPKRKSKAAR